MRGRKPEPTHLKLVRGVRSSRINKKEPKANGDLREPPEWMSESQKNGWNYAIEHAPQSLLKKLDRSILAVWVVAEDLHREASQKVQQFGLLTKAPNTNLPIQSPYLPVVNKQATLMLKAASELGFTPSSRSRIVIEDAEGETSDPAAQFFA